jgi:hypothetical protein
MKNDKTKKIEDTKARADARPTTDGADTAPLQLASLPSLEKQTVQFVLTANILASPFQPRKEFPAEEMEDLATSVRANGIRIPLLGRMKPNHMNWWRASGVGARQRR